MKINLQINPQKICECDEDILEFINNLACTSDKLINDINSFFEEYNKEKNTDFNFSHIITMHSGNIEELGENFDFRGFNQAFIAFLNDTNLELNYTVSNLKIKYETLGKLNFTLEDNSNIKLADKIHSAIESFILVIKSNIERGIGTESDESDTTGEDVEAEDPVLRQESPTESNTDFIRENKRIKKNFLIFINAKIEEVGESKYPETWGSIKKHYKFLEDHLSGVEEISKDLFENMDIRILKANRFTKNIFSLIPKEEMPELIIEFLDPQKLKRSKRRVSKRLPGTGRRK